MNINDVGAGRVLYQMAAQRSYFPAVGSTTVTPEDEGDGFQQSQESGKLKAVVDKYDLANISGNDLTKMGEELYNKNLITADEKQTFSAAADCPLKKIPEQQGVNGDYTKETDMESSNDVKMDYIAQWKRCKSDLEASNNPENNALIANAGKVLDLFEKIGFYQQSED